MMKENDTLTDAEIQGLKWIVWLIKALKYQSQKDTQHYTKGQRLYETQTN